MVKSFVSSTRARTVIAIIAALALVAGLVVASDVTGVFRQAPSRQVATSLRVTGSRS